jgi:hypothetical protein
MPHDIIGTEVKPGAIVLLAAVVLSVSQQEQDCNLSLRVLGDPKQYCPELTCNAGIVELVRGPDELPALPPSVSEVTGFIRSGTLALNNIAKIPDAEPEPPLEVRQCKAWRKQIDHLQTRAVKEIEFPRGDVLNLASEIETDPVRPHSRPRNLCSDRLIQACGKSTRPLQIEALCEAAFWLGADLKLINEERPGASPDPYPESRNPDSARIEPTADGLKFDGIGSNIDDSALVTRMEGKLDALVANGGVPASGEPSPLTATGVSNLA